MASIKRQVLKLIEQLPENAMWDEIMDAIFVRRKIAESTAVADAGKVVSHEKVKGTVPFMSGTDAADPIASTPLGATLPGSSSGNLLEFLRPRPQAAMVP